MENEKKQNLVRLIRELCNGKPISELQPSIIPDLLKEFEESKKLAIANGQVERLKKLQHISDKIEEYENQTRVETQNKKRKNTFLTKSKKKKSKKVPDSVLEPIFSDVMAGNTVEASETYLLPSLIDFIRRKLNELLMQGEYHEAQKVDDVHRKMIVLFNERTNEEQRNRKRAQIVDQLEFAQKQYMKEEKELEIALQEHDEKANFAVEALNAEATDQLEEFDSITNGPLPSHCVKFSSDLLNLKETEKFLVKSRRFEEAASAKEEIDRREQLEIIQLQKRFVAKRSQQRRQLVECFATKRRCMIENNNRIRMKIEQDHEAELAALKRSVENQQKKLDVFDGVNNETISKRKASRMEKEELTQETFVTNRELKQPMTPQDYRPKRTLEKKPKTPKF